MIINQGFDFDDVLIVPKLSAINSRDDVSLVSDVIGMCPIISSPMKGISGKELVYGMYQNNCIGILHRFFPSFDERINSVNWLLNKIPNGNFGVSVGIREFDSELHFAELAIKSGIKFICVDVANGYIPKLRKFIDKIESYRGDRDFYLIAGNVATYEGALELARLGTDMIRCGIGNGSLCLTRNATGIGVPQLTALEDCYKIKEDYPLVKIIADGGIRNSGDAVKAFAVGADLVMLGSLLSHSSEADNDGEIMGMASKEIQINFSDKIKSVEGMKIKIDKERTELNMILEEFKYGIKSACTYLNSKHYLDIMDNSEFVLAGKNSIKSL